MDGGARIRDRCSEAICGLGSPRGRRKLGRGRSPMLPMRPGAQLQVYRLQTGGLDGRPDGERGPGPEGKGDIHRLERDGRRSAGRSHLNPNMTGHVSAAPKGRTGERPHAILSTRNRSGHEASPPQTHFHTYVTQDGKALSSLWVGFHGSPRFHDKNARLCVDTYIFARAPYTLLYRLRAGPSGSSDRLEKGWAARLTELASPPFVITPFWISRCA